MGRISLKPRRGRVSFYIQGRSVLSYAASHLAYRGPLTGDRKAERALWDRGRIRGFETVESQVPWMELSGFGAELDSGKARKIIQRADELDICWQSLGSLRLYGFEVARIILRPEPGGALFELSGPVKGPVRRSGWVGDQNQQGARHEIHQS